LDGVLSDSSPTVDVLTLSPEAYQEAVAWVTTFEVLDDPVEVQPLVALPEHFLVLWPRLELYGLLEFRSHPKFVLTRLPAPQLTLLD
jgi:hypothetical protein